MFLKIVVLLLAVGFFFLLGYWIFRSRIRPYHALTWALIEGFWYMSSFAALCVGLVELERIEKLNDYLELDKALTEDYYNKKNLLHAQAWILKLDQQLPESEKDGVLWFHKMRTYFDEGMGSVRWEHFLRFSKNYVRGENITDLKSNQLEFDWPQHPDRSPTNLFLKEEINWMIDSLQSFKARKNFVQLQRPPENTNYKIRYILISYFLLALGLKFLKIYADYRRNTDPPLNP